MLRRAAAYLGQMSPPRAADPLDRRSRHEGTQFCRDGGPIVLYDGIEVAFENGAWTEREVRDLPTTAIGEAVAGGEGSVAVAFTSTDARAIGAQEVWIRERSGSWSKPLVPAVPTTEIAGPSGDAATVSSPLLLVGTPSGIAVSTGLADGFEEIR